MAGCSFCGDEGNKEVYEMLGSPHRARDSHMMSNIVTE